MRGIIDELDKYTNIECSKMSEACVMLVELYQYRDTLSKEFNNANEAEIRRCLEWYQKNTQIINRSKTRKTEYQTLEYIGD